MATENKTRRSYAPFGTAIEASNAAAGLYLVATPIGNLGDVTLRALELLAGADVIACEDTRVTRKLTERFGIVTPLTPYHEHNAAEARPKLLARLAAGQAVALVSDAGTPLISDPGFKLVRAAYEAGSSRNGPSRRVRCTGGPIGCRIANGSVFLRRFSAAQESRAAKAYRSACQYSRDARAI